MNDHPKHEGGAREGFSRYNIPLAYENNPLGGTSTGRAKSAEGSPVAPHSNEDDEAQANSDLLAAWTQRLQSLTVVTTFLASTDGMLFSLTALNTQIGIPTGTASRELVYSCLAGALIFHICACILGYIASFALIRYRITDAVSEEETKRIPRRIVLETVRPLRELLGLSRANRLRFLPSPQSPPPPPLSLLTHCYFTTLCLTTTGFIMALTGILSYIWAALPVLVGIFSTVCLGVAISAVVWALAM